MSKQLSKAMVKYKPLFADSDSAFKTEYSLDTITFSGYYLVEINHNGTNVGLPVEDCGETHYIVATLVVTDSGTEGPVQNNRVIGQVLTFTSRKEKETKVYCRTLVDGKWSAWRSLAVTGMFDDISSTDELVATVTELVDKTKRIDTLLSSEAILSGSLQVKPNTKCTEVVYSNIDGTKTETITLPVATAIIAGLMSPEDKMVLSSVELNTYLTNTPDSDNLINFEKPLYEGYYVASGGVLSANSNYNVYLVPMSGKSVTINVGGGFVLAAVDKAGKITHVNSENAHSNKTIEYNDGDVYALVSVPKSNNTFVARYADTYISDFTKYNTPVGVNDLEKLDEKCTDVYNVVKNSYQSTVLSPARILKDYNITITNNGNVNLGGNSYNNCYAYNVSFLDKRDYVKINTKTAISSVIGFNSSTSPTSSPITVYRNIVGVVNLIITADELGNNTHIWFACDKDVTPDVQLFSFFKDEVVIPNNNVEPKETTFFNRNLFNPNDNDVLDNTFLYVGGSTATNDSYMVTGFIPFNKDMGKLIVSSDGNTMSASGAAYCLYDANKKFLKGYTYKTKLIAEWEDGVSYARFSIEKGKTTIISIGDTISPYIEYGKDVINNRHIANQYCGVDAVIETIESIADGDIFQITKCPYYIKKNVGISMSADLTAMGTVVVGKGYNQYRGLWVEVDNTKVKVYRYESSASAIHTAEHGLSINTFIRINVFLDGEGCLQIILFSVGGYYRTSVECGYEMNYQPFVLCRVTSLSNVKLGVSCADIRLPVWVFGDSYLGVASNRWPGIMKDFGFFNVMFDGLSGINSSNMYNEIQKLLSISTPKYIVWCLGMNDSTPDGYKSVFDSVKLLCKNAGVTMIATTIPTVPARNKEEITDYVKSSGVRYIDMYSAVGATPTGAWHEGMLDSDGVHPTKLGAQALAMQVLTEFPEIMQYGTL